MEFAVLIRDRHPVAVVPVDAREMTGADELLIVLRTAQGTYQPPEALGRWVDRIRTMLPAILDVLIVSGHRWLSLREIHPDWPWSCEVPTWWGRVAAISDSTSSLRDR